jgi:hypothetical protein
MLLTLAIYLDRIEYPPLNKLNIHRFVLAGLRIAAKFLEDLVWKHDRYAKVVGVTTRELSRLELGMYLESFPCQCFVVSLLLLFVSVRGPLSSIHGPCYLYPCTLLSLSLDPFILVVDPAILVVDPVI